MKNECVATMPENRCRDARSASLYHAETEDDHDEAANAAAALVLRNRDAEPVALVLWAEVFQKRQRAERTEQRWNSFRFKE